ncbi:MAG: hypothetical protein IKJ77_01425 [Firmicutes bacterium]|nr:hypothetical protein [Bacillota bacterium]
MRKIYLAKDANKILQDYLTAKGYDLELVSSEGLVDPAIACHPDVFFCRLGIGTDAPLVRATESELGCGYPAEAAFNGTCTGRYFIHNLKITSPRLLDAAHTAGMELIHVPQGYAKCSTVIIDERSIITYDRGIARACTETASGGPDVLLVSPGHVLLPGYKTGFIGGCSGRVDDEVIFNGDLAAHPDFAAIHSFIEERGLKCTWFDQYPLTDIGSII